MPTENDEPLITRKDWDALVARTGALEKKVNELERRIRELTSKALRSAPTTRRRGF